MQSEVQVNGDDTSDVSSRTGAGTVDLNTEQISRLPEDPDDLLRQLQALAGSSGGDPVSVTVYVDGFQSPSAMPPSLNSPVCKVLKEARTLTVSDPIKFLTFGCRDAALQR